jgi:hypothetical protein
VTHSAQSAAQPEDNSAPCGLQAEGGVHGQALVQPQGIAIWNGAPAPAALLLQLDQRWQERAFALIAPAGGNGAAVRRLATLISLSLEHFTALVERLEQLHQILGLLRMMTEASVIDADGMEVVDTIQELVLQHYLERIGTSAEANAWLVQLRRSLEPQLRLERFLRHCGGETLQAIAASSTPAVSREAVRHNLLPIVSCLDACPKRIAQQVSERREQRERMQLASLLQRSLERIGRFPFHSDGPIERPVACSAAMAERLEGVAKLNLNRRLALHAELAIPVPEAEWALHLRVIANNEEDAGAGYWHHEEALREFLHRYAALLGTPGLMPKQKQLPDAVRGAVQRLGGQSAVAALVGLKYQGQLVGENGRTYWTEARLIALLEQTVAQCGLAANAMPSKPQITAFLASGVVPEYRDKQPNSVFAALSRQSRLSWPQVAERFGRMPQG